MVCHRAREGELELGMSSSPPDLRDLEAALEYAFARHDLLEQAITHASYVHEQHDLISSNETLEFLGDAVLELIVSDYALRTFPEYDEGQLTRFRAACVGRSSLAKIARSLKIGRYLRVGRGEERSGGRGKTSLLANAVEAIIAAIYLDAGPDGGLVEARRVVLIWLERTLGEVMERGIERDEKSLLQEHCQQNLSLTPGYALLRTWGPDHSKKFEVEVRIGEICHTLGQGRSKKSAEQAAAQAALQMLGVEINRGK